MNAGGDLSLISKRGGGINDRDALCDQGKSGALSAPSSHAAKGRWVVAGEILQEKLNKSVRNWS